jgi:DNA polymerase III subunit alpha
MTRKPILPFFTVGAAASSDAAAVEAAELKRQAEEGLGNRLQVHGLSPGTTDEDYKKRLAFELDVIMRMKYAGYFLIVADFIKWAKGQGIPVGPGRGSGAGSLVAWALTITDLDPIKFGLLFERFLNPERVSMPDFDIDFCQDRRGEVIDYVQQRYGRDQVAQIITFGTLQARGVLRDVGRVLQMPYGQVDKLTKLVPQNPAAPVTLAAAIESEPKLQAFRDEDPVVARAFDIAQRLEGLTRHASTHAAGIVIGDRPLSELVPMYRDPKSDMPVTQFNMKWVEPAGLVKFDFLGLKTLTVLDVAIKLLKPRDIHVDLATLPIDDAESYQMLARGEVVGVFQVESQGMRRALVDMRPDRFEDIIALVALYRPGPMANIPTYCLRKHGDEEPEYLHPVLEPILKETFGVIIYQEQVMQIAQVMSGYSLGDADLLRRAMGKKIRAEMEKQREIFVAGAVKNGVPKAQADTIFELLAKFADYGFNKSHAAAYALVSYHTAYMKAHYPVEFIAASMTLDLNNTDKLSEFRSEAQRLGIKVEPPNINRSGATFEVGDKTIYYALAALKGVGIAAVEQIIEERTKKGLFTSLADFAARVNPRAINKRVIESLAAAGAFDMLEPSRARVFAGADAILAACQRAHQAETIGQNDMFGSSADAPTVMLPQIEPWLPAERLRREYDAIGFFLSGHPLDDYATVLKRLRVQSWAEFSRAVKTGATAGKVAATVVSRMERRTKTGNKMGIMGLSDPTGHFEAVLFSEGLAQYRDVLEPGAAVLLQLGAELQGEDVRARVLHAEPLDDAAAKTQKGLRIFVRDTKPLDSIAKRLAGPDMAASNGAAPKVGSPGTAPRSNGDGEVSLVMMIDLETEVEMKLPGRFKVSPQIAGAIKAVAGVVDVQQL